MEILLTNDDGYRAKGIGVLAEIMSAFGNVTGHVTDTVNEDHCDDWASGGGGNRYGPGKLH